MRRVPGFADERANGRGHATADVPSQASAAAQLATRTEQLAGSMYVVSVAGEIDLFTAPPFNAALVGALDAGATALIVDLSDCCFMDSSGLEILIGANKRLNHSGQPVAVVTDHPSVLLPLRITGLDGVLAVHSSRSAALNGHAGD
jgi:anti-sigma B factor antagonist